jgi:hypothetical protein
MQVAGMALETVGNLGKTNNQQILVDHEIKLQSRGICRPATETAIARPVLKVLQRLSG